MFAAHRLPGIGFEAVEPPAPDALPRMDIALFAGFASKGPVHRPVALDDYQAFRRWFGDEVALATVLESGILLTSSLAPTVRAFFANGGKQCWVVRVARTAELQSLLGEPTTADGVASSSWFEFEGLAALHEDGSFGPARAQARSLGSWADSMEAAARVERTPFVYEAAEFFPAASPPLLAGAPLAHLSFTSSLPLSNGDLVQFEDAQGSLYAAVEGTRGNMVTAVFLAELPAPVHSSPPASPPLPSPEPAAFPQRPPHDGAIASRVTLELQADDGLERQALDGLGLTSTHPKSFWQLLPDDRLPADASQPGFPIAGFIDDLDPGQAPLAWLPFGLNGTFSTRASAQHDGRASLQRDGLSNLAAEIFLDPELANESSGRIMDEAERVLREEQRPLFGIHSVLGIGGTADFNPVSLLAVPDASQPGWVPAIAEPAAVPASDPSPPAHWFDHRGPCAAVPAAMAHAKAPDRSRFLDCSTRVLATPQFVDVKTLTKPGAADLHWTDSEAGARFALEMARRLDFADAEIVYDGSDSDWTGNLATDGFYYFRLTANIGDEVSAPALVGITVRSSDFVAISSKDYSPEDLLKVQRAMLRLASASGEIFALLSLPRHFRIRDALDHARRLRGLGAHGTDFDPFDGQDRRALSFGALHHPWLRLSPDERSLLAAAPPDGAVAGVHAKRTLARGAWIAAANEIFKDVVALEPAIADDDWALADEARINLLRRDPRGFILLDSDTLSGEPEWRQINVRRLMCLVRRVALRRGATYVFEPNGDVLRRSVERGFSQLLERMFRLGAFVGDKAEEAFRLAVTTSQADRDEGRLVVEIGVAPSQPMRFLNVRLVQSGGRFAIAEEG